MKHNEVCAHIYYSICNTLGIETVDILYTHTHTYRHTNQYVNSYENMSVMELRVYTNREVMENRPDTIIKNKKGKRCKLTCYNTCGLKYHSKGNRKENMIQ